MEEHTFQQMQDEMSRFEAEISGAEMFMPGLSQMRPVIGAGTFGTVQQQLERGTLPPPPPPPSMMPSYEQALASGMLFQNVPPPPPPPSMMVPPQVQRQRHMNPMNSMGSMNHMNAMMDQEQFSQYMNRPVLPGPQIPPPKPQPVILSAAPKLYKKPAKSEDRSGSPEHKKKKREHAPPAPPPQAMPEPPSPPAPAPALPAFAPAPSAPAPPPPPIITEVPAPKTKKDKKNRKVVRTAGGQVWEDVTLLDWPDDDFRMFCGDLGNDVTDELLIRTFSKYSSFQRAKVIRDKRTNKSKGFGFVSFKEPVDFIKAMKDMDGRYVGSRPIKLRKSTWRSRALDVVRKKEKEKAALLSLLMAGKS